MSHGMHTTCLSNSALKCSLISRLSSQYFGVSITCSTMALVKHSLSSLAPMKMNNGETIARTKGTPQGGVISPILANLFLHYTFDSWMGRKFPEIQWCRYADDGLAHLKTEKQAEFLKAMLEKRLKECKLEMHPEKTKIVTCSNRQKYRNKSFDFLGYTFRSRGAKAKKGEVFTTFLPAVSKKALKEMNAKTRKMGFRNKTNLSIEEISKIYNPILRGWYNYYGRYYASALSPLWRHFNRTLIAWMMKKFKKVRSKTMAGKILMRIAKQQPKLFIHWEKGIIGSFV